MEMILSFRFLKSEEVKLMNKMKLERCQRAAVPNFYGARDRFHGRQFFHGPGWEG